MEKPAPTLAPIHSLIQHRWSPRAFKPIALTAPQTHTLLEAARWSASCFNEQPWRFLIANRDQSDAFDTMLQCLVPVNRAWAQNAGLLLLAFAHTRFQRNDKPNRHAHHDLGLAAGQLALQATAMGLQAHMMAGIDIEHIKATYQVPDDFDPLSAIAVGTPDDPASLSADLAERERAPRERREINSFCFSGDFDKPWSSKP